MKNKAITIHARKLIFFLFIIFFSCSIKNDIVLENEDIILLKNINLRTADGFEISYWIDIDLRTNDGRGYWFHASDLPPDSIFPTSSQIWAACSRCRYSYHGLTLYVIYHRQFEIEHAKNIFQLWKYHANNMGMKMVPVVLLEDYVTPLASVNFSDYEIADFADWCINNINSTEFGVYEVWGNRQLPGQAQNSQLAIIKNRIGNKIVRLGLQPGEIMNPNLSRAIEDAWTAQCQGLTNALWENPVNYLGTNNYGKNLLLNWVNDRVTNEARPISWCLIPVAWDYDNPIDSYGYICPGDDALINDPPPNRRTYLSHQYIVAQYPNGCFNPRFGGYSCDLHIIQANSEGRGENPNFYNQIKMDQLYTGYYSTALNEIATIYDLYDN